MKWRVTGSLVCPNTGIAFSSIGCLKNLKLVIWYECDTFLPPGGTVEIYKEGILINGNFSPIIIYHISPFNTSNWESLKSKLSCPGNHSKGFINCDFPFKCNVKKCPYK